MFKIVWHQLAFVNLVCGQAASLMWFSNCDASNSSSKATGGFRPTAAWDSPKSPTFFIQEEDACVPVIRCPISKRFWNVFMRWNHLSYMSTVCVLLAAQCRAETSKDAMTAGGRRLNMYCGRCCRNLRFVWFVKIVFILWFDILIDLANIPYFCCPACSGCFLTALCNFARSENVPGTADWHDLENAEWLLSFLLVTFWRGEVLPEWLRFIQLISNLNFPHGWWVCPTQDIYAVGQPWFRSKWIDGDVLRGNWRCVCVIDF